MSSEVRRISVAILALGGQGGGVLSDWIVSVARQSGWRSQSTSIPGVAQRTGSTVYYVELIEDRPDVDPVLSLMPVPGDVEIVIASELMEAGRAILRGFVDKRTTLIGSTHRTYAIGEKSARGNGIASSERILDAASTRSKRFIGFDMAAAAEQAGCPISAVMLGALASSEALPFHMDAFAAAIRRTGKAVEANLRGFELGREGAAHASVTAVRNTHQPPRATTALGRKLEDRVQNELPAQAHAFALEGVARLLDYQDADYAHLYVDRLVAIERLDSERAGFELTRETARHLALWMSYEDTIRVADLKIRGTRLARIRRDVRAGDRQLLRITEFMHPRYREVCETMPRGLGAYMLGSPLIRRLLGGFFTKGRFVETNSLRWTIILHLLAALRPWRRTTLRFHEENERIETWLAAITRVALADPWRAVAIVQAQRLIKGYGDTFESSLAEFNEKIAELTAVDGRPQPMSGTSI